MEPSGLYEIHVGFCRKHWGVMGDRSGETIFFQSALDLYLRWKNLKYISTKYIYPIILATIRNSSSHGSHLLCGLAVSP